MSHNTQYLGLDIGEKRIGIARADSGVKLAYPYKTLSVDERVGDEIRTIIDSESIDTLVVGYPRNQSGEPTAQSAFTTKFINDLSLKEVEVVYQDESVTSVLAEERLIMQKQPYEKGDIDKMAASIILQDYLETRG